MSYELCDYTLSFLEMLHHVLFNSYRQVVKLDVVKMYSKNPRTVVKFMKWDEYVKFQDQDTNNTKAEGLSAHESGKGVQSKRTRHERANKAREAQFRDTKASSTERPGSRGDALRDAGATVTLSQKKKPATTSSTHKEA
jgi:hypothetical protein